VLGDLLLVLHDRVEVPVAEDAPPAGRDDGDVVLPLSHVDGPGLDREDRRPVRHRDVDAEVEGALLLAVARVAEVAAHRVLPVEGLHRPAVRRSTWPRHVTKVLRPSACDYGSLGGEL